MTESLNMLKHNFFLTLTKLSQIRPSSSSGDLFRITDSFLESIFEFCRHHGPKHLDNAEKQTIVAELSVILPTLESGLPIVFLPLDADRRQTGKIYRSAIQFLIDDLSNLTADTATMEMNADSRQTPLSVRVAELLKSGPVESLDENLGYWQDDIALGEFPFNPPSVDITGVPDTHIWWTEDDRNLKK